MNCPKCGAELRDEMMFCSKCGEKVQNNIVQKKRKLWPIVIVVLSVFIVFLGILSISTKINIFLK